MQPKLSQETYSAPEGMTREEVKEKKPGQLLTILPAVILSTLIGYDLYVTNNSFTTIVIVMVVAAVLTYAVTYSFGYKYHTLVWREKYSNEQILHGVVKDINKNGEGYVKITLNITPSNDATLKDIWVNDKHLDSVSSIKKGDTLRVNRKLYPPSCKNKPREKIFINTKVTPERKQLNDVEYTDGKVLLYTDDGVHRVYESQVQGSLSNASQIQVWINKNKNTTPVRGVVPIDTN